MVGLSLTNSRYPTERRAYGHTGSSTGIGLATALVLGRARHHVYATMRSPERSPELRTIAQQESLPINILRLDVNDDD